MTAAAGNGPLAVLVNPSAGKGRTARLLPGILARLDTAGRQVRPLTAASAAEADEACRAAVADGAGALVAVGGDGTVHLALQAVAGTGVPFGVVPVGTGNDFATEVGVPTEPSKAADAASHAARGTARPAPPPST